MRKSEAIKNSVNNPFHRVFNSMSSKSKDMVRGSVSGIIRKSGYIQRCAECDRVIHNGHCVVHVDEKAEDDLRVKASIQGKEQIAVINSEVAEELLEISIEEAKEMDEEEIEDLMEGKVVGEEFEFRGKDLGNNFIVDNFERV